MKLSETTGLQAIERLLLNNSSCSCPELLVQIAQQFGEQLAELSGQSKTIMRLHLFERQIIIVGEPGTHTTNFEAARRACST
jgi:hypothetical protein